MAWFFVRTDPFGSVRFLLGGRVEERRGCGQERKRRKEAEEEKRKEEKRRKKAKWLLFLQECEIISLLRI